MRTPIEETAMQDVSEVIGQYSGHSRLVLEYSLIMKRMVDRAKRPGFTADSWGPLAELVAVDEFERVGNFKEVMNWSDYTAFLTRWTGADSDWECSFKGIAEVGNVVYLELEERSKVGSHTSVVNSLTVYKFNAEGRLRHLDIYLQMEPVDKEMLKAYAPAT
jgi:hypothetical protein